MANFSKRTWEKISSCLTNTLGNKAKTVLLFGSQARGDAKINSDIDIAILSDSDISYEISLLREELEELDIAPNVDVVDMSLASKSLINNIKKDGIAWEQLAKDLD